MATAGDTIQVNSKQEMDTKDKLVAVLKEYDAIHKEIEDKTNTFQTRGIPIILLALGSFFGWQAKVPVDIVLFMIPAILMLVVVVSISAWFLMDRAGRWLAEIEERVYRISGEPLMTHETTLILIRQRQPLWIWPVIAVAVPSAYVVCEYFLFWQISQQSRNMLTQYKAFSAFLAFLAPLPALMFAIWCIAIFRIRRSPFSSRLAGEVLLPSLEESATAKPLRSPQTALDKKWGGFRGNRVFWSALVFYGGMFALAIITLRQFGSPKPWARMDVFSVGYLVLISSVTLHLLLVSTRKLYARSVETLNEASALGYDRITFFWGSLLGVAELAILLDYAHWRLTPTFAVLGVQIAGLVLLAIAMILRIWVDRTLLGYFASGTSHVLRSGPYRLVRHPRYLSILAAKASVGLIFGSVLGVPLSVAWIVLMLRRIRHEEQHLETRFGEAYSDYARSRARLVPGIY